MVTASNSGMTCARSFPLAGVVQAAHGMPPASVRLWIRIPLPFLPWATPSPPPLPGGTGAVDGPVLPLNQPVFFSKPEDAGLQGRAGAIGLPALELPMRGAFRSPWRPAREITPAAARDQHVQQRIHDLAKRGMRHAPPALCRLRGKDVCKEWPFQVAQTLEASGHSALLHGERVL